MLLDLLCILCVVESCACQLYIKRIYDDDRPIFFSFKMKDIEEVEKVQRRAAKEVKSLRGLSHEQPLKKLNLPTLKYRRHRGDMIEFYKTLHRQRYLARHSTVGTRQ